MTKIKYNYNCKNYFGVIYADSLEEAKEVLNKDHTGVGDKMCNWDNKTKETCQKTCNLKVNI
jgi:hypothetical protein